jgi:hypothetical protein
VELYTIHDREELREYCELTNKLGVKIEVEAFHYGGVWNAMRLHQKGLLKSPIWTTFFLGWKGGCWTPPTVHAMTYMADHCPKDFVWNTFVMDPVEQWKVLATAISLGGHVRIGMEDNPFISGGEYARTNADLVIIVGFFTRLAAVPLIIIMIIAIVSTKVPILLGHDFWIFHVQKLPRYGFWSMAHEARADFDMLLGIALPADRGRRRMVVGCGVFAKLQGHAPA